MTTQTGGLVWYVSQRGTKSCALSSFTCPFCIGLMGHRPINRIEDKAGAFLGSDVEWMGWGGVGWGGVRHKAEWYRQSQLGGGIDRCGLGIALGFLGV